MKAIPWRPNSAKAEYMPLSFKDSDRATRPQSSKSLARTEPFYMSTKDNSKGLVYSQFPNTKSVRKAIPIIAISEKEEPLTTKEVISLKRK